MSAFQEHVPTIRAQFPALSRALNGQPVAYFDGPGGTQVPRRVIDAMGGYLAHNNANSGGLFATSRDSDAVLDEAHRAVADLLGTDDADTVVFGQNMTTLTFALSRSLARAWGPGDEVLVTRLDHDANVTPWVMAAKDAGATVRFVGIHKEDCTLDREDFRRKLSERTRLVAVACASNSVGTINPVRELCAEAHDAGALVFVDAVHFAPHALIDVNEIGCDFLACSAYKFFGPHLGILWGRRELLEQLTAYKVRPAPAAPPGKWMTGTQNHEGIAGTLEAVDYLAELGRLLGGPDVTNRRAALRAAFEHVGVYESELTGRLLNRLAALPEFTVHGITAPGRLSERLSTVSITHAGKTPTQMAEELGQHGLFTWHGNYYAVELTEALGLEPHGMLRIGMVHYNTMEEVDRLLESLENLA